MESEVRRRGGALAGRKLICPVSLALYRFVASSAEKQRTAVNSLRRANFIAFLSPPLCELVSLFASPSLNIFSTQSSDYVYLDLRCVRKETL